MIGPKWGRNSVPPKPVEFVPFVEQVRRRPKVADGDAVDGDVVDPDDKSADAQELTAASQQDALDTDSERLDSMGLDGESAAESSELSTHQRQESLEADFAKSITLEDRTPATAVESSDSASLHRRGSSAVDVDHLEKVELDTVNAAHNSTAAAHQRQESFAIDFSRPESIQSDVKSASESSKADTDRKQSSFDIDFDRLEDVDLEERSVAESSGVFSRQQFVPIKEPEVDWFKQPQAVPKQESVPRPSQNDWFRSSKVSLRQRQTPSQSSTTSSQAFRPFGTGDSFLTKYKVLSFDIYGTLINWETGIFNALLARFDQSTLESNLGALSADDLRSSLLSIFHSTELRLEKKFPTLPYPLLLKEVFMAMAERLEISTDTDKATSFGQTISAWPPFKDSLAAMKVLQKYYKLVVLSNVSSTAFAGTVRNSLSGVHFDAIYTADEIGSYKPDLKNFEYLIEHVDRDFKVPKDEILHVANSLTHDHIPAKKVGLKPGIWIERRGERAIMSGTMGVEEKIKSGKVEFAGRYKTLGLFADAVKEAWEGTSLI